MTTQKPSPVKFISGAKTQREDTFARLIVSGKRYKEAFKEAGFTSKRSDQPKKIAIKESVSKAIIYYRKELAKKLDITEREILLAQAMLANFNPQDTVDLITGTVVPLHHLPRSVAACVKKYTTRTYINRNKEEITEYSYDFYDKQKALSEITAIKAALKPQQEVNEMKVEVIAAPLPPKLNIQIPEDNGEDE